MKHRVFYGDGLGSKIYLVIWIVASLAVGVICASVAGGAMAGSDLTLIITGNIIGFIFGLLTMVIGYFVGKALFGDKTDERPAAKP